MNVMTRSLCAGLMALCATLAMADPPENNSRQLRESDPIEDGKSIDQSRNLAGLAAAPNKKVPLSREAVQSRIDVLRKEGVAWQKIAWNTYLLDALRASCE